MSCNREGRVATERDVLQQRTTSCNRARRVAPERDVLQQSETCCNRAGQAAGDPGACSVVHRRSVPRRHGCAAVSRGLRRYALLTHVVRGAPGVRCRRQLLGSMRDRADLRASTAVRSWRPLGPMGAGTAGRDAMEGRTGGGGEVTALMTDASAARTCCDVSCAAPKAYNAHMVAGGHW